MINAEYWKDTLAKIHRRGDAFAVSDGIFCRRLKRFMQERTIRFLSSMQHLLCVTLSAIFGFRMAIFSTMLLHGFTKSL